MENPFESTGPSFEDTMVSLGLGTPLGRFAAIGSLAASALLISRPAFAFDDSGPRPWSVSSPANTRRTPIPWWMPAFAAGLVSATFL